jgi:hypothetical protein
MTSKLWDVMNDLEMVTSKIVSAREIIDTAAEAIQKNEYDKAETLAMAAYEFLGYYLDEFDAKFKLAWQETVVKQKKEEEDAWDAVNKEKEYYEPSMPPWGHSDLEYMIRHKEPVSCDKDDPSPECKGAWNSFWEENHYPEDFEETLKREGYEYTPLPVKEEKHSEHYYDYSRNDSNRLNYEGGWIYESPDGGKTVTKRRPGSTEKTVVKKDKVKKWVLPVQQSYIDGVDDCFVYFPEDLLEAANLKEGDTIEWIDRKDGSYELRKVTKPLGMDEC